MSDLQQFILNKLEKLDEKLDGIKESNSETKIALEAHTMRDEQIQAEVKKLGESVAEQCKRLGEYNEQLKIHISTNHLLMARQDELDKKIEPILTERHAEHTARKWLSAKWSRRMKIVGYIGLVLGVIATAVQIITSF